jgi:hypothetical protein
MLFIFILLFIILSSFIFSHSVYESFDGLKKNKYAIITSIYGDYDNIKEHDIQNKDLVDWYCFTDNKNMKSNTWNIINTPYHLHDKDTSLFSKYKNYYKNVNKIQDSKTYNMMCAKYYKIKSHNIDILQPYDYFIWIDGSILLQPHFIENMISNCNNYELINFKHSVRDNIKDEYKLSITIPKYKKQDLKTQYYTYLNSGFTDKIGLFENTIFARRNNEKINNIFDKWWIHNLKYSYQDQISYPFVLWQSNFIPDGIIKSNVFNNTDYSYVDFNLMKKH